MAGCLGRQVSRSCPTGGGGEDAQAPKGSERAGWDLTIKICKFLSCPPAWATILRILTVIMSKCSKRDKTHRLLGM